MDEVALLYDLVSIPSVNPMGQGHTGREFGEELIARRVSELLAEFGMEVQLQPFAEGRVNALGRVEGRGPRSLLLEAHTDTVLPTQWRQDPFTPVEDGDRLIGLGACDTKGSLAAMLAAVGEWLAEEFDPARHGTLVLLADGDEEHRFRGLAAFHELGIHCDGGVVGEPTGCRVVTAHKAVVRWRLHTTGKAAHSSTPEHGHNAIYDMARLVTALERYNNERLATGVGHPRLGAPTLSVGTIQGGTQVNIVPERCVIDIDRRVVPGEDPVAVMNQANRYLRDECGLEFVAEPPYIVADPLNVPAEAPIVRAALAAREAVLGKARPEAVHYGSNAGRLTAGGIPCVVFGPGDIAQAHQGGEFTSLSQVRAAKRFYRELISRWQRGV